MTTICMRCGEEGHVRCVIKDEAEQTVTMLAGPGSCPAELSKVDRTSR